LHYGFRLEQGRDIVEQMPRCWQGWSGLPSLIVLDAVTSYGAIKSFLPPQNAQFRVLLTSRSRFEAPVQNHEIKVLSVEAALELLRSLVRDGRIDGELEQAQEICRYLGYLPLALELVGRYLAKDPDLLLRDFWVELQSDRIQAKALAMRNLNGTTTAELGVLAAFELSWLGLTAEAQRLAAFLSIFALAEIPWDLVEQCLAGWDPVELKRVLREELCGGSLVDRKGRGIYELHQLLWEFFGLKLLALADREDLERCFAEGLTAVATTVSQIVVVADRPGLIAITPHLSKATELSRYLPADDKTWCCTALVRLYQSISQFDVAISYQETALKISEEQLGPNHPDTATSLNNLAGLYRAIGNYGKAEPLYVRSLDIREKRLEPNHLSTATNLNNLAALYYSMGNYEKAEPLYVRSLDIREKRLEPNHPDTAAILNNLAELYRAMGDYGKAKPLCVRSLRIREEQPEPNHPDTAAILNNLAGLYYSMGNYGKAEPLYVRSLDIREEQLGPNHPDTATSLNDMAGLYQAMGDYGKAEPLYVRSLGIYEERLGLNHPETAMSLNNLAELYQAMGDYGKSKPLYVRSLEIREEQLGPNHPDTATSLNNLAGFYYSTGKSGDAIPLYLRSLQIAETTLGTDHPTTQTIRHNLEFLRQPQTLAKITPWQRGLKILSWPFDRCYQALRWLIRQLFSI
jgi:tetratricopeptide (TPR) repeat protein